jgi:hypothetical protein
MPTARGRDPLKAALSAIDAGLTRIAEHGSIKERSKRLRPRTDLKYPWA